MEVDEPLFKEWIVRDGKDDLTNYATSFGGRISQKGTDEQQNLTLSMLNSNMQQMMKQSNKEFRSRTTLEKKETPGPLLKP
jgi:hypothetical protein